MLDPGPTASPAKTSQDVVKRFALRLVILAGFASASSRPFWPTLMALLIVAAGLSFVIAFSRREIVLGPMLNHWDEAAVYALLSRGVGMTLSASS